MMGNESKNPVKNATFIATKKGSCTSRKTIFWLSGRVFCSGAMIKSKI